MRLRHLVGSLTCVALFLTAAPSRAGEKPDPFRLVPAQFELVFKVENPKQIADNIYNLDIVQDFLKIDLVRQLYESTNARRVYQLVAYFEKQLGHDRFELLDRLAGGGLVLAGRFTGTPAFLAVMQAKDEAVLKKFFKLTLDVVEDELARQGAKGRPQQEKYRNIDVVQIDKVRLALAGSALVVAADAKTLHAALDCHLDGSPSIAGSGSLAQARKMLPDSPQAWVWVNLERLRTIQAYREAIKQFTGIQVFYAVIGPIFDVAERSPFACAGLYQNGKDFMGTIRMAAGRKGMSDKANLFLPEKEAPLQPLEPANVVASLSYHLDLGKLWQNKRLWLSESEAKGLEKAEEAASRFMAGIKLGKLLSQAGTHQRMVFTQPIVEARKDSVAAVSPFAVVIDMRDPAFGKSMEAILRGVALFGSFQFNLKMVEEKRGPYTIVSYRLEDAKKKKVPIQAAFLAGISPCFVRMDNDFIASSHVDLCRELVDLVAKERTGKMPAASTRINLYAAGAAAAVSAGKDQFQTQLILAQAISPKAAQEQINQIITLVRRLGVLRIETHYGSNDFRYDFRLKIGE